MIKIWITLSNGDEFHYEFERFCVSHLYNYILGFPYGSSLITKYRQGLCKQIIAKDANGDIRYRYQAFGDIAIGLIQHH